MSKLKVAVLGTGALGKEHARIYAELAAAGLVEFVGVYDTNPEAADQVAARCGVQVFPSTADAIAAAEALSIVTPTVTHYTLARQVLEARRHCLVEKPMTNHASQAAELVELAAQNNCILQVGHVERFNPIFSYLQKAATEPRFIETHRLSPYPKRSTDIGVVLDLMIHDLDVVLAFVPAQVIAVDAVGVSVLSQTEDIANARLRFANGCVANLTVSRVSPERMRKIRVFSGGTQPSYISLDYRAQEGFIYRLARENEPQSSLLKKLLAGKDATLVSEFSGRRIVREAVPIEKSEPLRRELEHFVRCAAAGREPAVSGAMAKRALDLALEISRQIQQQGAKVS